MITVVRVMVGVCVVFLLAGCGETEHYWIQRDFDSVQVSAFSGDSSDLIDSHDTMMSNPYHVDAADDKRRFSMEMGHVFNVNTCPNFLPPQLQSALTSRLNKLPSNTTMALCQLMKDESRAQVEVFGYREKCISILTQLRNLELYSLLNLDDYVHTGISRKSCFALPLSSDTGVWLLLWRHGRLTHLVTIVPANFYLTTAARNAPFDGTISPDQEIMLGRLLSHLTHMPLQDRVMRCAIVLEEWSGTEEEQMALSVWHCFPVGKSK